VTAKFYGLSLVSTFNKEADWNSDAIKCALFTSAYSVNQDTDQYYDALSGEVANGSGYATGGKALATPTIAYDTGTNVFNITSDSPAAWTSATFTARYAVIYDSTPGSNKPLLCYVDFGADVTMINGTFTFTIAAGGHCKVTVS
jgi:hypothetical protein